MPVEAISTATVRDVLRALRYATPLRGSPLLNLDVVTLRLRAEDLADTRQGRAWVLGRHLEAVVDAHLRRRRGEPAGAPAGSSTGATAHAARPTADAELAQLQADLRSGNADRLDWALLHWRYLSPTRQPVRAVGRALGVADRTVQNRVARGVAALTNALRQEEVEATRQLEATRQIETTSAAPATDRVVVDETAEPRDVVVLLGELQALLDQRRASVRISRAQLEAVACHPAAELIAYRLGRIAEWSLPRYRLDRRFVDLSLLVDLGEESQSGRWRARDEHFTDLRDVLAAVAEPAVVLLGPPGSGKSTLLRRLELDHSRDALGPGDVEAAAPLTFFVSLNQYRAAAPDAPLPAPKDWLAERWAARYPLLPPLGALAAERGVVYLLDGLNELPHRTADDYRDRIAVWKQFLVETVTPGSGHRAVIACRSLDYSAPLSTPALRVPQVQVEPLADARVEAFLQRYSPANAAELWNALRGTTVLEALRWPFFLRLLVEAAEETGRWEADVAALFTSAVRRALVREIERHNPLLDPNGLVDARDYERILSGRGWRDRYELPERGSLFGRLADLAHGMQAAAAEHASYQVRIRYAEAVALLGDGGEGGEGVDGVDGARTIRVGAALGVLDEDRAADDVMFQHQLVQEYFAGRKMARTPDFDLVRQPWQAALIRPGVDEVIAGLGPAEVLPPLPSSGWEETALLAAVLAPDREAFLGGLMKVNLSVAGRAAAQAGVRECLPNAFLDALRWALVRRSRDPAADLRERIACGRAVGDLGDPRFERRAGACGAYLWPPIVEVPGGEYPIGSDVVIEVGGEPFDQQSPLHTVRLDAFAIGRYVVTNAEWACFMAAGGYDDPRWWGTDEARAWRAGEGTAEPFRRNGRFWRSRFLDEPGLLAKMFATGQVSTEKRDVWRDLVALDEDAFEADLAQRHPDVRFTEPVAWRDERFNGLSKPVVGVCWYEARAYCRWLADQSGLPFRLPTEVEWEAMARGPSDDAIADERPRGNVLAVHVRATTPVGVFPDSDTPLGATDTSGNVTEWTSSAWGRDPDRADFGYPYDAADGRERPDLPSDVRRVLRSGAWLSDPAIDHPSFRGNFLPSHRTNYYGFRVALDRQG